MARPIPDPADVFYDFDATRATGSRSRPWVVWRRTSTAEVEVASYASAHLASDRVRREREADANRAAT